MNSEKLSINLKNYALKKNNYYSFVYENILYYGKFIEKKNKLTIPPQTLFIFKEFTIKNHIYQPLQITYLIENTPFSDSESESDDENENENENKNENENEILINNDNNSIDIEYDLINDDYLEEIDINEYVIL
jgi:hypothetical protein